MKRKTKMASAETEQALIDHNHDRNNDEQKLAIMNLKDTKYSWFICSCAFLTQVFILGVLHAFGVFFVEFLKEFNAPKGEAAWIGSLAYGLSMTFGPVTSILIQRFGYRKVMMAGGLICAVSITTSSFATSVPQLFVSFSLLYGIGTCMATGPTMTITSVYFDKYLTIATGITVSGSSFGTLIMGPLSQAIIDTLGWRNAFRIYAGLHIVTVILNSRIKAPQLYSSKVDKKRSLLLDFQIWKNRVFVVWTTAITLVMFGFYIPYVHLVSYAIDQGISADRAAILMMVLGACTASGRILFGKIVQSGVLNRLHMHQLSMVVTGTGVMLLPLITSYIGIVLYVVTVGLVDGCYVVLLPILTTSLVGIENSVLAWGFLIGASSITFTLGPPVAGALYDMTGSYNVAFHCAGVPIVAGAVILFLIPWAKRTSKHPNIMEIVNEYTASETFRMNSETGSARDTGAIISTIDDVVQTIAMPTSSFVTVRSVATETDEKMFYTDKSTSTSESSSYRQRNMDIDEALSQLSRNDVRLSEMLRSSFASENETAFDYNPSPYIPRIPPPSDPGQCYITFKQDDTSSRISRTGSNVGSSCHCSLQPSLTSGIPKCYAGVTQDSVSEDVFSPSGSHLFNLSTVDSSWDTRSGELLKTDHIQGQQVTASTSRQAEEGSMEKTEEGFDRVISSEVGKLLDTLKIPSPNISEEYDMDKTIVQDSDREQKRPTAATAFAKHLPTLQDVGPSNLPSTSAPQPHESPEPQPKTEPTSHSFGAENQLTVIPAQNPFIKIKSKFSSKLEDLFSEPDSLQTRQSTSFEVVDVGSSGSIQQTKSASEIDVFKHLFDDDDNNEENSARS